MILYILNKWYYIFWTTNRDPQISPRFALGSLGVQKINIFGFSKVYKFEFEIFEKEIGKSRNSKVQKSKTYFYEDHWDENFKLYM